MTEFLCRTTSKRKVLRHSAYAVYTHMQTYKQLQVHVAGYVRISYNMYVCTYVCVYLFVYVPLRTRPSLEIFRRVFLSSSPSAQRYFPFPLSLGMGSLSLGSSVLWELRHSSALLVSRRKMGKTKKEEKNI